MTFSRDICVSCPNCGYATDAHAITDPARPDELPTDGDVSLCLACASPSIFTNHVTALRPPTSAELAELRVDSGIEQAIGGLVTARERALAAGLGWPVGPGAAGGQA